MIYSFVYVPNKLELFSINQERKFIFEDCSIVEFGKIKMTFSNKWNYDYWKLRNINNYHEQYTLSYYWIIIRYNFRKFVCAVKSSLSGW